jgi:hypothetical protein
MILIKNTLHIVTVARDIYRRTDKSESFTFGDFSQKTSPANKISQKIPHKTSTFDSIASLSLAAITFDIYLLPRSEDLERCANNADTIAEVYCFGLLFQTKF